MSFADQFATAAGHDSAPGYDAAAITPGSPHPATRGIYVGGDGDITCLMAGGTTVTFTGVLGGSILPVRVKQVTAATATNLVALT